MRAAGTERAGRGERGRGRPRSGRGTRPRREDPSNSPSLPDALVDDVAAAAAGLRITEAKAQQDGQVAGDVGPEGRRNPRGGRNDSRRRSQTSQDGQAPSSRPRGQRGQGRGPQAPPPRILQAPKEQPQEGPLDQLRVPPQGPLAPPEPPQAPAAPGPLSGPNFSWGPSGPGVASRQPGAEQQDPLQLPSALDPVAPAAPRSLGGPPGSLADRAVDWLKPTGPVARPRCGAGRLADLLCGVWSGAGCGGRMCGCCCLADADAWPVLAGVFMHACWF